MSGHIFALLTNENYRSRFPLFQTLLPYLRHTHISPMSNLCWYDYTCMINSLCINGDHFPQSRFLSFTTSLSCLWHIHMDNISNLCWYACDNYTCTLPEKYRDNLSHSRLITMPVQTPLYFQTMSSVLLC